MIYYSEKYSLPELPDLAVSRAVMGLTGYVVTAAAISIRDSGLLNAPFAQYLTKAGIHQAVFIHIVYENSRSCLLLISQLFDVVYLVKLLNQLDQLMQAGQPHRAGLWRSGCGGGFSAAPSKR